MKTKLIPENYFKHIDAMILADISKAAITRAFKMTDRDWAEFFETYGNNEYTGFTAYKNSLQLRSERGNQRRRYLEETVTVNFIELTAKGKAAVLEHAARDISLPLELVSLVGYINNRDQGIFELSSPTDGVTGTLTVMMYFPMTFIHIHGYAKLATNVPVDLAIKVANKKRAVKDNNPVNIGNLLASAGYGELVTNVAPGFYYRSTWKAIEAANRQLGLEIDKRSFIDEIIDTREVIIRPTPESGLVGTFTIVGQIN